MKYWMVGICLWVLSGLALAQSAKQPWDQCDKPISRSQSVGTLGPDLFDDSVSFYNGALKLTASGQVPA
jgi:hypothetical protein